MKDKTEQIRAEFKDHCKSYESYDTEANADRLADWWLQKLAEQREEIVNWCKKRCEDNITINGTDKWNGDLEDLIEIIRKK